MAMTKSLLGNTRHCQNEVKSRPSKFLPKTVRHVLGVSFLAGLVGWQWWTWSVVEADWVLSSLVWNNDAPWMTTSNRIVLNSSNVNNNNTATTSEEPSSPPRERGVSFSLATRHARAMVHRQQAIGKIQHLQKDFPLLNLSDLLLAAQTSDDSVAHVWTPQSVENIVWARQYYENNSSHPAMLHFFCHIPKTGGTSSAIQMVQLLRQSPHGNQLLSELQRVHQPASNSSSVAPTVSTNATIMTSPPKSTFRPCNYGNAPVSWVKKYHNGGHACTMWIMEHRRPPLALSFPTITTTNTTFPTTTTPSEKPMFSYTYTLIRNPRQQVISQYFHCKESGPHRRKAHYMPSTLVEWLMTWNNLVQNLTRTNDASTSATTTTSTDPTTSRTHSWRRRRRWWYSVGLGNDNQDHDDPQPPTSPPPLRRRPDVGFLLGTKGQLFECYDPRNQQSAYTDFALEYRQKHLHMDGVLMDRKAATQDLESRFDFVGITDRMTESNCLFVIYYTGWVPPACDCTLTNDDNNADNDDDNDSSRNQTELSVAHGVQHHGSSYETSPLEDHLLNELTRWDQLLYSVATDLFWKRLIDTEYEYGVKICEVLRTDVPTSTGTWLVPTTRVPLKKLRRGHV